MQMICDVCEDVIWTGEKEPCWMCGRLGRPLHAAIKSGTDVPVDVVNNPVIMGATPVDLDGEVDWPIYG